jgi:hypothetical protein
MFKVWTRTLALIKTSKKVYPKCYRTPRVKLFLTKESRPKIQIQITVFVLLLLVKWIQICQFSSTTSTSSMTSDTKMSSLFDGNTYIYGRTFNFNNPQSSQKRQSDDSGLQIAKTTYKRILPLSFSDSDSEWTLVHFSSVIIRLNYTFNVWTVWTHI